MSEGPASSRTVALGTVLVLLGLTLALGHSVKAPCVHGAWGDGRPFTRLCALDVVRLLGPEQLTGGRLPYLDACEPGSEPCDEYPVVMMWTMRLAAWASGPNDVQFFYWNAVILWLCALWIAFMLYRMVGSRALYFATAPTLALYATYNWDLLAVLLTTGATFAYLKRKDVRSGALLGLGAATKLYPALLLAPFIAGRLRDRELGRGTYLAWAAATTWIVVNVPFALAAPDGWLAFFRLSRDRPASFDSLWFLGCQWLTGIGCTDIPLVNIVSAVLFVSGAGLVWALKVRRDPSFSRWTLGFPIIALFLITNKVYSPQYSLWLLPWFALALPDVRLFLAFEITDVAVFVTEFSWFGTLNGIDGGLAGIVTLGGFGAAFVLRAVVLLVCVVAWVRRREAEASVEWGPTTVAVHPEGQPA